MTARTLPGNPIPDDAAPIPDVGFKRLALAFSAALAFVVLTRLPVARPGPVESDEFGFLEMIGRYRLPMHHTLFLASARVLGDLLGDRYRGFLALDMLTSAGALVAVWWWLRALVRPSVALAATAVLAVGPVFWGYGAMAGNYTAIPLVGGLLLGTAVRAWTRPKAWHAHAAAVALALGTGYRQDIGTFWLPVFFLILVRQRWTVALQALGLFTVLNLAWLGGMLVEVGGLAHYRAATAEFSRQAGYMNSVWHLGFVDAPVRYAVKLAMALVWTLGAALLLVPLGVSRLAREARGRAVWTAVAMLLAVLPALGFHLLVHFGVPGYAFHYVPALLALAALGAERFPRRGPAALLSAAALSAAVFLFYPADFQRPGLRGNFDLSFARHTRTGLNAPLPGHNPTAWRTANSRPSLGAAPTPSRR